MYMAKEANKTRKAGTTTRRSWSRVINPIGF